MRIITVAAVGMCLAAPFAGPASAQSVGDVGRQLLQNVLPGQQQPRPDANRERNAYEQGRVDAERERRLRAQELRRERAVGRDGYNDRRRGEDVGRYRRDRDAYEYDNQSRFDRRR